MCSSLTLFKLPSSPLGPYDCVGGLPKMHFLYSQSFTRIVHTHTAMLLCVFIHTVKRREELQSVALPSFFKKKIKESYPIALGMVSCAPSRGP